MKESDIVYETEDAWVIRTSKSYEVYVHRVTHGERKAIIGLTYPNAFEKAKAYADGLSAPKALLTNPRR